MKAYDIDSHVAEIYDQIETKSTIYHNAVAEIYESSYKNPYWQLYFEITWRNLKKYLPRKKKAVVLDAGGGTGFWSRRMAKRRHQASSA